MKNYLSDIPGVKVGHSHNQQAMTGCTVIITPQGATAGLSIKGAAPGTRETALLKSDKMIQEVHAVLLTGGSAFGLAASDGVMKALEEKNIGFDVGVTKVPIVPTAVLFDLHLGQHKIRPDYNMGYQAVQKATANEKRQGKVGVGIGCSVGKLKGIKQASPSGIGSSSYQIDDKTYISALVALNSFGDILNNKGEIIAGCKDSNGRFINTATEIKKNRLNKSAFRQNTTLGVIATNASLSKVEANKLSAIAHNGYAKHINPVHTNYDGDSIFTLSTGREKVDFTLLSILAVEVISQAIINAITNVKHP